MTRVTGVAIDQESGQPVVGRPVYAFIAPRTAPMNPEPINPPNGVDRTKTNSAGEWELNLRRTLGTDAHYIIRVWQHSSYAVDVPAGPGPFSATSIAISPGSDDPDPPDNWQLPQYVKTSEKGQPSGVATLGSDGKLTPSQRWAVSGPGGPSGPSGPLAYRHEQFMPSSVWNVVHDLEFTPSGIVVLDHLGARHYPEVTFPNASTVHMTFSADVRGVAHLS